MHYNYNREFTFERRVSILQLIGLVLMALFFYSVINALSDPNSTRQDHHIESKSEQNYNH